MCLPTLTLFPEIDTPTVVRGATVSTAATGHPPLTDRGPNTRFPCCSSC